MSLPRQHGISRRDRTRELHSLELSGWSHLRGSVRVLDEDVIVFHADEPWRGELILFRSAPASSGEALTGRRVQGQSEEVLRLDEIGDEAASKDEVDEAEDVGHEDEEENDVEDALPFLGGGGGKVLRLKGCVEGLILGRV